MAAGIPVHCAFHALGSIHDLKAHPQNSNLHPENQLILYAAAIKARGWREAITVSNRSGFIVTGHGALLAARRLGVDVVPVEYQDYASEDEELADLLAHNRLPELSRTDRDLLKEVIQRLDVSGLAETAGFTSDVVADLLATVAPEPQYPITARLNESYHLFCVAVDNETDWQYLKNLVGIRVERSYKNATIGEGHAMRFSEFIAALRANAPMLQ